MTTLQCLLILMGFATALAIVYANSVFLNKLLIHCLKAAFILKIAFFILMIVALPFRTNGWSSTLLHLKTRYFVDLLYVGCFIGYHVCLFLFATRLKVFKALLFDRVSGFYRLVRLSASCTFLFSAMYAIFFFDQSLTFFISCGYTKDFMIFIIGIEMLGAVMLLFKKAVGYASLLLTCDMIGAVFTHFHNYFLKNFPNPFKNSVPALITLTLLVTIIYLNSLVKKAVSY